MRKLIVTNTIIPIFSILFLILENIKVNGERLLSIKYRMWMFDYGFFLIIAQLIVLFLTFFIWKKKQYRAMAVGIFLIWMIVGLLLPKGPGLFD
jgi:L-asparagine transporter-like permease